MNIADIPISQRSREQLAASCICLIQRSYKPKDGKVYLNHHICKLEKGHAGKCRCANCDLTWE